ncbi:hypothetical protein BO71DRAFT_394403 [Aspergillus ellipticus CBS 707.79]|uniref:Uncharacterized protein n=1 Tax=Aspergillus ellipticus CBS 707.79 TaxID=1448320 RepID=A0A319DNU5_9EURO|nr:hypothetical protein BO71DRAFT_394403 [Aspergillus ellipticus CBS 707.79]
MDNGWIIVAALSPSSSNSGVKGTGPYGIDTWAGNLQRRLATKSTTWPSRAGSFMLYLLSIIYLQYTVGRYSSVLRTRYDRGSTPSATSP